jgi:TP901 family phage tail tape measure protein
MAKYTVPTVFTAIDKLTAPTRKMTNNASDSFARMERKVRKFGDASFRVARKSAMVGTAMAVPLIAAGNEAVKFEEKMSNISTLLDTNAEDMDKMGQKVLNMATRLPVPLEELTTSLYDIRSAGIEASKGMNTLEVSAKLSKAGLSTASEATDLMTSSLNAFQAQGLSAQETSNILFKTVKFGKTTVAELSQSFGQAVPDIAAAGITLQDFSAATAALTTLGQPASVAQNRLARAISKLNKPTAQMEKLFKKLGVKTGKELIDNSENLVDVFGKLDKAAKDNNINLAKAWGSSEALGASTALLGAQNKAYTATLKDMNSGTDAVTEAYDKQSKTAKSSMQVVKNNIQVLGVQLGQALLPIVADLAKAILPLVQSFARWAKANPGLVASIAKFAVKAIGLSFAISGIAGTIGILSRGMIILRGVQTSYNVVMGVTHALMGKSPMSIRNNAKAMLGYTKSVKLARVAQVAFNLVASLGPFGLIAVGAAAAGVAIYALSKSYKNVSMEARLNAEVTKEAMESTRDHRAEVTVLFQQLKLAKGGSESYNDTLKELENIIPGVTEKYDLQEKSMKRIAKAQKEVMKNIITQAKSEVRAKKIKEKLMEAEEAKGKSAFQLNLWTNEEKYEYIRGLEKEAEMLARIESESRDPSLKVDRKRQEKADRESFKKDPMLEMLGGFSGLASAFGRQNQEVDVNINIQGDGSVTATAASTGGGGSKPIVPTTN